MRRLEAVQALVPRRGAGEDKLGGDADEGEIAEAARKDGRGAGSGKEEEESAADGGGAKVAQAVREPGEQVQDGVGVGGQDVGEVCAV